MGGGEWGWGGFGDKDPDSQDARLKVAEQWRELSHSILVSEHPQLYSGASRAKHAHNIAEGKTLLELHTIWNMHTMILNHDSGNCAAMWM